jgi:hypothetical protein
VQQYERLIKAMLGRHKLFAPCHDLERARAKQIDAKSRMTLGGLVTELFGSYVVTDQDNSLEEMKTGSLEGGNSFAMQMTLALPAEELARVERELREMVKLRNNLVHHFVDEHDLWSSDGCRGAKDVLLAAYERIDQHLRELYAWAQDMKKAQQRMSEVLLSKEFQDVFANGFTPDENTPLDASSLVKVLREAHRALAVDGWARVGEAEKWIAKRYPEQQPASHRCRSWHHVVHEAPTLDLRYFEMEGQLTACYREQEIPTETH